MRLLVFGSRDYENEKFLHEVLDYFVELSHEKIEAVIEGEAQGADTFARHWAEFQRIPVLKFPANWTKYGRAAGPMRNKQMIEEGKPDYAIGFIRGSIENSKGSKNMYEQLRKAGIPVDLR